MYVYITVCLVVHLLTDTWVVCLLAIMHNAVRNMGFWPLCIMLLGTWVFGHYE